MNFLIVGTQKGGTTALTSFLRQHGEICLPRQREVHFFDDEQLFQRDRPPYELYHQCFEQPENFKVVGENTPIYMYWRPAAKRIFEYNAHIKMIFILRNPIDRAYSAYNMEVQRNMEPLSFCEAIRSEESRCKEAAPLQHRVYSYCDRGFYSRQIRRLLRFFPIENMLFLKNEELRNNHGPTLAKTFEFLGVDTSVEVEPEIVFSHRYEQMCAEDRDFLREKFHEEVMELARLLGWDCSDWLE